MTTDDPLRNGRELAGALRAFHKAVIDAAIAEMPGAPANPFAQLTALMRDPAFAWLQPLSGLVANTDHVLRTTPNLDPGTVRELRRSVEAVLGPTDHDDAHELRARIGELTPGHPEVAIALAEVRHVLAQLPEA